MKAILLFHLRVGVRLALQSFIPLFSAVVALIMFQMYPAAAVAWIARAIFGYPHSMGMLLILAALTFIFPAWAASRMTHGLNAWMRHLPISDGSSRRGLTLALVAIQSPLAVGLLILLAVARAQGVDVSCSFLLDLVLLLTGAAISAVPVKNRLVSVSLSIAGALAALFGNAWPISIALFLLADASAGPMRVTKARRPLRESKIPIGFRIAWRALGWQMITAYALAALPLGCAALFIRNSDLEGALLAGTARFFGSMSAVVLLSFLSAKLCVRRPVWPWVRSLPWSSYRRVLADALLLALHATAILIPTALINIRSALVVLLLLPLLACLAAAHTRRLPERRSGIGPFVMEGLGISAIIALAPWTAVLALAAAPAASFWAQRLDSRQKVTLWLERRHHAGGDSLSWSS
ncbi:MAG: hypothetical protein ABSC02_10180 [Acidobacteriota bacterium]|jgi:hypothetical protein